MHLIAFGTKIGVGVLSNNLERNFCSRTTKSGGGLSFSRGRTTSSRHTLLDARQQLLLQQAAAAAAQLLPNLPGPQRDGRMLPGNDTADAANCSLAEYAVWPLTGIECTGLGKCVDGACSCEEGWSSRGDFKSQVGIDCDVYLPLMRGLRTFGLISAVFFLLINLRTLRNLRRQLRACTTPDSRRPVFVNLDIFARITLASVACIVYNAMSLAMPERHLGFDVLMSFVFFVLVVIERVQSSVARTKIRIQYSASCASLQSQVLCAALHRFQLLQARCLPASPRHVRSTPR